MTTKTITITEDAYEALKSLKETRESFSETILRVARIKPLSYFYGCISRESGKKLEKAIMKIRKSRNESHAKRLEKITRELKN
ncbi:MAG: antitoxin VapB family protein [Ignavibacteriae bacterium]|nr:antitoxin VapB family protein [Ignavibacteriota bacterium]